MRIFLFHLFQILVIYLPGAAFIPVVVIASFYSSLHALIGAISLLAIIATGLVSRSKVAIMLGLDRDYE